MGLESRAFYYKKENNMKKESDKRNSGAK